MYESFLTEIFSHVFVLCTWNLTIKLLYQLESKRITELTFLMIKARAQKVFETLSRVIAELSSTNHHTVYVTFILYKTNAGLCIEKSFF